MAFFDNVKIPITYHLIDTPKKMSWLVQQLKSSNEFAYDIETNHATIKDKDKRRAYLKVTPIRAIGISFAWGRETKQIQFRPSNAAYVPLYKTDDTEYWGIRQPNIISALKDILETKIPKVAQNGKFDSSWLYKDLKIKTQNFKFDTMLAHVLLDEEGLKSSHALKSKFNEEGGISKFGMSDIYLDTSASSFKKDLDEALIHYDAGLRRYSKVPIETLYPYACADADLTLALKYVFEPMLEEENLSWVFYNVVMPLQHAIMQLELHGMPLHIETAQSVSREQKKIMSDMEKVIHKIVGKEFLVSSNDQLGKILFEELHLPGGERGKTGWKVDVNVLERLDHPIVEPLLKYRRAQKIGSTYADASLDLLRNEDIHGEVGFVHPNYNLLTVTGRLSCDDPNLTNLPKPEKGGDIVKGMWICPEGYKLIFKDFSQIELRVLAHCSGDPIWLDGFINGLDMHSAMAKKIWNLPCTIDEVKKDYKQFRSNAKAVNFGIAYGMTAFKLSKDLDISIEEAESIIQGYYEAAPVLKAWMDSVHQFAEQNGYVYNIFGRRRHLPNAQIKIPERVYWPNDRPECYRRCMSHSELGVDLKDIHEISEASISQLIKSKRNIFYNSNFNKCSSCTCLKSCFINTAVKKYTKDHSEAMRQSVNTIIQGSAADMASLALIWMTQELKRNGVDSRPVVYVHDEIGCYTHVNDIEKADKIMDDCMITKLKEFTQFRVPILVDTFIGGNWGEKG